MYSFGDKLKELRTNRGHTLDELADKVNAQYGTAINKGMLSKWENNHGEPRLDTARVLASFFKVSLDELLELDKSNSKNEIETIAAHHDGEDWTEEEMKEIEIFKQFVRSKRGQKEG
ncbi:helix-turn-helix transcriptional regulator [Paenibacillus sp. GbtcB18]|uniref:helix-turn-helix domain-containing protein n=1 Tax=Paenibacillus sp. GbtcB18 TaxID=2824763 RepID=UPI002815A9E2|nr:helix-turn-helix transcriptional regulator [Paenibacillus sp. GbtcB18]